MVKAIKKQSAIFIFLKLIVVTVIAVFFYVQFKRVQWDQQSINLENPLAMILVVVLIPLNWYFEWSKWSVVLKVSGVRSTNSTRRQSFFAGIVTGMLTPNMLGNFLGRIYYFERRHRLSLTVLTLVSNYAQFIASIVFGLVALFFLKRTPLGEIEFDVKWFLILIAAILVVFYFYFEWIFRFSKRKARIHLLMRSLEKKDFFRWKILVLSILRHSVFVLQFSFMLFAFGEDLSWSNMLWIWQLYLWVTLAPSLFLGKLAIRESVAIWVLGAAGMSELAVLVSSFLIWTFNLLLPTLVGLIICTEKK
ncbi:MAG: lysylphosphatidylglycerol synthase domain-containing protein [Flavobacteriia bacterium]